MQLQSFIGTITGNGSHSKYVNLTWLPIQVHNNFCVFCQLSITLEEQCSRVQQEGARHRAIVTACFSAFTHAPNAEAAFMKIFVFNLLD